MKPFAAAHVSGSQTISSNNDSITPTFAIFTCTATTVAGTPARQTDCLGWHDGRDNVRVVGVGAEDAAATTNVGALRDDNIVVVLNYTTGAQCVCHV